MPRRPADPDQLNRWVGFLRNHEELIAAEQQIRLADLAKVLGCRFRIEIETLVKRIPCNRTLVANACRQNWHRSRDIDI